MVRIIFSISLLPFLFQAFGEGTQALRPALLDQGAIELSPNRSNFGLYNSTQDNRIYIRIDDTTETLLFGFGRPDVVYDLGGTSPPAPPHNMKFRIKAPDGTVVFGEDSVPDADTGFIANYNQAIIGPKVVGGSAGYEPFEFHPDTIGDFYIEFTYPTGGGFATRRFHEIDFTVMDKDTNEVIGRLWSRTWQLTTGSFTNTFQGNMYVYSDDSITTAVDFNGIQPFSFSISCNQTGCTNTGNIEFDRASRVGNVLYAQYKLFLNPPDSNSFPTGRLGLLVEPINVTGCDSSDLCININVTKAAPALIFLDIDTIQGYQEGGRDRLIEAELSEGNNCIPWDYKDGEGNLLNNVTEVKIVLNYNLGITHLPIYDVENHRFGYKVSIVRPVGDDPKVFWDDSAIPQGSSELAGCDDNSGCHEWPYFTLNSLQSFGESRTINTWWNAVSVEDSISFPIVSAKVFTEDTLLCPGEELLLTGTGDGDLLEWSPVNQSGNSTNIIVNEDRLYYLIVTDTTSGCTQKDSVFIAVEEDCMGKINAPTIFTPNNDNQNDAFYLLPHNIVELSVFRIFNRWGKKVFETNDISIGWDGTKSNVPQENGVYVYYAEGTGLDGGQVAVEGTFVLVR